MHRRKTSPHFSAARAILAGLVGVALALSMTPAAGAQGGGSYPDLVADPPESVQPPEVITWLGDELLAVPFDGFVTNIGEGPLHIEGNPQPSAEGTAGAVAQHILGPGGATLQRFPLATTGANPAIQFENSDGHQHWHLMEIMEYSLWNEAKTQQMAAAAKIGFCLFDLDPVDESAGPPVYAGGGNWCASGDPNTTHLEMGVSPNWRDVYNRFVALQWVDVSEVAPGHYYLAALADPNDIVEESNESNNSYSWTNTVSVVPGYLANAVGPLAVTGPQAVALGAQSFGSELGPRTFVVVSGPSHGTLNVATGTPFAASIVTYTPTRGYNGQDSFTYYAYDAGSAYPTNRDTFTATLTLDVAAPAFGDVPTGHLFGDAINWMAAQGISLGCGDGSNFCPDDPVSRAQVASFLTRAFNLTAGAGDDLFTDDDGNVHENSIDALATAGITLGCTPTTFCPARDVTRAQFASLLVRATGMSGGEGSNRFTDDNGSVHEQNIDVLAHNGVTSGCTTTTFCPNKALTRGQLAQLLYRAIG